MNTTLFLSCLVMYLIGFLIGRNQRNKYDKVKPIPVSPTVPRYDKLDKVKSMLDDVILELDDIQGGE